MDANELIERLNQLAKEIDQSAAQHNALLGRSFELKELLNKMTQETNLTNEEAQS